MASGRVKPFSPRVQGTAVTTASRSIGPYTWGNSPANASADGSQRSSLVSLAGIDAQQHEVGDLAVEPVGDVVHLGRQRAVDEALAVETRRPVRTVAARRLPLRSGRDVEDEARHEARA